jgi:hypothetical protein
VVAMAPVAMVATLLDHAHGADGRRLRVGGRLWRERLHVGPLRTDQHTAVAMLRRPPWRRRRGRLEGWVCFGLRDARKRRRTVAEVRKLRG